MKPPPELGLHEGNPTSRVPTMLCDFCVFFWMGGVGATR